MRYESYTKEDVMKLYGTDLLTYINYMLSKGYTLGELNKTKGIRRQTVRDRLKKDGYAFDKEQNQYVYQKGSIQETKKKLDNSEHTTSVPRNESNSIKTLEDMRKALHTLEIRVRALEENKTIKLNSLIQEPLQVGKLNLVAFHSKAKNRNYPLYPEVYERLDRLREENPHIKIKDVVNSILYKALLELEE